MGTKGRAAKRDEGPVVAALRDAPKGDPALLTAEDRVRIEQNRRSGRKGVPQAVVEAMLAERKQREGE
jgi:hypothetical protein